METCKKCSGKSRQKILHHWQNPGILRYYNRKRTTKQEMQHANVFDDSLRRKRVQTLLGEALFAFSYDTKLVLTCKIQFRAMLIQKET